jgi:hypothetical protein
VIIKFMLTETNMEKNKVIPREKLESIKEFVE